MNEVYVLVMRSDGSVAHVAVQLTMRAGRAPLAEGWTERTPGIWTRDPTDANLQRELDRFAAQWARDGVTVVRWRRLAQWEHELFNENRRYRSALTEVDGTLQHDLDKAKALHRAELEREATERIVALERQWIAASMDGDTAAMDVRAAERLDLLMAPQDARVEAALTLNDLKAVTLDDAVAARRR